MFKCITQEKQPSRKIYVKVRKCQVKNFSSDLCKTDKIGNAEKMFVKLVANWI